MAIMSNKDVANIMRKNESIGLNPIFNTKHIQFCSMAIQKLLM